jgi:type IV pilus assembly protein PilE
VRIDGYRRRHEPPPVNFPEQQGMQFKQHGVTLIELIVVMIVVGVLAAIAIPSYRQYVLRTHRVEAKTALLNLLANQEKFYLQNNTYADDAALTDAPPAGLGLSDTTENGWYGVAITAGDATGFSATATAAGAQTPDTHCTTFTIDQAGVKTATSTDCW